METITCKPPIKLNDSNTVIEKKKGPSSSSHLLYHHPELALPAEDRFDPRQPLYVREDFGRTDQDLARVETIRLVEEQTLENKHSNKETISNSKCVIDMRTKTNKDNTEPTQGSIVFNMYN